MILQAISWGLGTARVRAALGRALVRVALVLAAGVVLLLEAAQLALASVIGPTYAAVAMGVALIAVAAGLWFGARQVARRPLPAMPVSTGEAGKLLLILVTALAGFLATRRRDPSAE
jgi:F0F1-type ATP synthase assembly protein I